MSSSLGCTPFRKENIKRQTCLLLTQPLEGEDGQERLLRWETLSPIAGTGNTFFYKTLQCIETLKSVNDIHLPDKKFNINFNASAHWDHKNHLAQLFFSLQKNSHIRRSQIFQYVILLTYVFQVFFMDF